MEDIEVDKSHKRPLKANDITVEAVGKVTEAIEWVERARGDLYEFHQKIGHADEMFADAAEKLKQAGYEEYANLIMEDVSGRNVLYGRWTFQMVEEFDDGYYTVAKNTEREILNELMDGKRHVFESELKEKTRTKNKAGHESRP